MLTQPSNLGGGIAGLQHQTQFFQAARFTAQAGNQLGILRAGFGVAPQLGGVDRRSIRIERHHTVLLAGNANTTHLTRRDPGFVEGGKECAFQGRQPLGRCLLTAAIFALFQAMGAACFRQNHAAFNVDDHYLGTLGTAIYPDIHHTVPLDDARPSSVARAPRSCSDLRAVK